MIHRNTRKPRESDSGFTLVEVLIALFIFSLISVGATSALTSSLRGKTQMDERLTEISQRDSLRALIGSDMANIVLRQRREPYGNLEPYVLQSGGQTLLDFSRAGRSNPGGVEPRGDLQHVAYVFEDRQLIRRSYSQVNPAPQSPHVDRVLLTNIAEAKIELVTFNRSIGREILTQNFSIQAETASQTLGANPAIKLTITHDGDDELIQYFEMPS